MAFYKMFLFLLLHKKMNQLCLMLCCLLFRYVFLEIQKPLSIKLCLLAIEPLLHIQVTAVLWDSQQLSN